ncbi:Ribosome-binding factor A [hydrothermal vent metagenome]|uniref:Ribosome-binding factor A n=1 Tax=hydrothermal vent metagenome TaxID=652676 RepID=A0A3B0ZPK9_9ZZZZ
MPKEFTRTHRLSQQLQREVAVLIQNEIKDPRINLITVQDVAVSKDLSIAKVYISSLDTNQTPEVIIEILTKASGFLRRAIGKELTLRKVPELRFFYDDTIVKARELSDLIDKAIDDDNKK